MDQERSAFLEPLVLHLKESMDKERREQQRKKQLVLQRSRGASGAVSELEVKTTTNCTSSVLSHARDPDHKFSALWKELQHVGWTWRSGQGLVSWVFLRPGAKGKLSSLRQGVDYFESEEAVRAFVGSGNRKVEGLVSEVRELGQRSTGWQTLWEQLQESGWRYRAGSGLVAWLYVAPNTSGRLSDMVRGVEYFESEHEVVCFLQARGELKEWLSTDGSPESHGTNGRFSRDKSHSKAVGRNEGTDAAIAVLMCFVGCEVGVDVVSGLVSEVRELGQRSTGWQTLRAHLHH
jgi:hypothetical protein